MRSTGRTSSRQKLHSGFLLSLAVRQPSSSASTHKHRQYSWSQSIVVGVVNRGYIGELHSRQFGRCCCGQEVALIYRECASGGYCGGRDRIAPVKSTSCHWAVVLPATIQHAFVGSFGEEEHENRPVLPLMQSLPRDQAVDEAGHPTPLSGHRTL